jgi:hypothetical protein
MATSRGKRRQAHGSAWQWRQTDNWYYNGAWNAGRRFRPVLADQLQRFHPQLR